TRQSARNSRRSAACSIRNNGRRLAFVDAGVHVLRVQVLRPRRHAADEPIDRAGDSFFFAGTGFFTGTGFASAVCFFAATGFASVGCFASAASLANRRAFSLAVLSRTALASLSYSAQASLASWLAFCAFLNRASALSRSVECSGTTISFGH